LRFKTASHYRGGSPRRPQAFPVRGRGYEVGSSLRGGKILTPLEEPYSIIRRRIHGATYYILKKDSETIAMHKDKAVIMDAYDRLMNPKIEPSIVEPVKINPLEVEANKLEGDEIQAYFADGSIASKIPITLARNAILRGGAKLIDSKSIQQISVSEHERREKMREDAFKEQQKQNTIEAISYIRGTFGSLKGGKVVEVSETPDINALKDQISEHGKLIREHDAKLDKVKRLWGKKPLTAGQKEKLEDMENTVEEYRQVRAYEVQQLRRKLGVDEKEPIFV